MTSGAVTWTLTIVSTGAWHRWAPFSKCPTSPWSCQSQPASISKRLILHPYCSCCRLLPPVIWHMLSSSTAHPPLCNYHLHMSSFSHQCKLHVVHNHTSFASLWINQLFSFLSQMIYWKYRDFFFFFFFFPFAMSLNKESAWWRTPVKVLNLCTC